MVKVWSNMANIPAPVLPWLAVPRHSLYTPMHISNLKAGSGSSSSNCFSQTLISLWDSIVSSTSPLVSLYT